MLEWTYKTRYEFMKKIILLVGSVFLLSGCTKTEKGTLTCNGQSTANGLTSTISMQLEYEDDLLIKQIGDSTLVLDTKDGYDQMLAQLEQITSIYKTIDGASYTYTKDDEKLSLTTHSEIDVNAVDKAQLSMIMNYGDGEALNIDKIKESLTNQGYTCKAN